MIQTHGLCGLSGIAHGLMAISALDMMNTPANKTLLRAGVASFIMVVAKSIIEAGTGRILLEHLHFGAMGSPVAVCHAGGVLGGVCAWLLVPWARPILAARVSLTGSLVSELSFLKRPANEPPNASIVEKFPSCPGL